MSVRFLQLPGKPRSRRGRFLLAGMGTTLAAASFLLVPPCRAAREYTVTVDGLPVRFEGIGPVQVSGRVLVPLRGVLERTGAVVRWAPENRTVYARRGAMTLEMPVGQRAAVVNGRSVPLEVPAMAMRGTVMVPLRFVTEALGASVKEAGGKIQIATVPVAAPVRPQRPAAPVTPKPRVTLAARPAGSAQVSLSPGITPAQPAAVAPRPTPKPAATGERTNRTTVVGTVEQVNREAVPPTIVVAADDGRLDLSLAPAAVVLCREGETGRARESNVAEVCPGDRVMAKLDMTGKITILVAQYDQLEEEVAAAEADGLELKSGIRVVLSEATRVVLSDGAAGSPSDLHAGDSVRVRLRPGSRAASQVTVLKAAEMAPTAALGEGTPTPGNPADAGTLPAAGETTVAAPAGGEAVAAPAATGEVTTPQTTDAGLVPPAVGAPVAPTTAIALKVSSFLHDAKTPLRAGNELNVSLEGEAGAQATFDVGTLASNLAMQEVAPGKYVGKFAVPEGVNANVSIFGKLTRDGKASPLVQAGQPVFIDSVLPTASDLAPAKESTVPDPQSVIYAVYEDEGGSGVDPDRVKLVVAGEDVTTQATRTPRFITYRPLHPFANGPVTAQLTVLDRAGNQAETVWQFNVNAPEVAITSVTHNATRPVDVDQTFTVTVAGKPGCRASFDIGRMRVGIPMTEAAPGIYQARYTTERGDAAMYARIVAHLVSESGEQFTRECSEPITILTVAPKAPTITSPTADEQIEGPVIVTGRAQPGVTVRVQVVRTVRTLGLWSDTNVVTAHEVKVDSEGTFVTARLTLPRGRGKGESLTVQAVALDPAGHRSEIVSVKVKVQ